MGATGHAWGKTILLGDHAVVYGVPAVAVAIDRGVRARADALSEGPSRMLVSAWNISVRDDDPANDLARGLRALLAVVREEIPSLPAWAIEVESDLPPGGGLGCSAAIGVAVARAVAPGASDESLQARAMAWEQVFHGTPSGIDAEVAARGGCILFRKGHRTESVAVRGGPLHLCVGSTGMPSSTKEMVEAVARLRARRPDVVEKSFEGARSLVNNARYAIEAGDHFALGRLMDLNQMLLGGLFVSTPEIERMCALAREAGALGAKLTGAGGGGSVVALVPSPTVGEAVLAAWKADGLDGFATSVPAEVRVGAREGGAAS